MLDTVLTSPEWGTLPGTWWLQLAPGELGHVRQTARLQQDVFLDSAGGQVVSSCRLLQVVAVGWCACMHVHMYLYMSMYMEMYSNVYVYQMHRSSSGEILMAAQVVFLNMDASNT